MGRLRERLATARRALSTLVELPLAGGATPVERDAALQRLALMIYSRLAEYAAAMTRWVDLMDSRLPATSTGS